MGPEAGPGSCLQISCFVHATPLCHVGNFRSQKLGTPWENPDHDNGPRGHRISWNPLDISNPPSNMICDRFQIVNLNRISQMVADEHCTPLKDLLQPHTHILTSWTPLTVAKKFGTRQTRCIVLFLLCLLIRSFHWNNKNGKENFHPCSHLLNETHPITD